MLSLKWQSFPSHLAGSLDTCYEKQQFVDVSLVCKDGSILKCHKMILANSSTFFRRLLVANEHPHPMIILHDVEADDLKTILNFMYCGEIQVLQSEVRRLLKLAEILEVTGLKHLQTSALVTEPLDPRRTRSNSQTRSNDGKPPRNCLDEYRMAKTASQLTKILQGSASTLKHSKPEVECKTRKSDERGPASLSSQAAESQKPSGNVVDINLPGTSKSFPGLLAKRRKYDNSSISWSQVLSSIPKNQQSSATSCLMEEVEISATGPPTPPVAHHLDRIKVASIEKLMQSGKLAGSEKADSVNADNGPTPSTSYSVFIKEEMDMYEMEEDTNMEPLVIEDVFGNVDQAALFDPGRSRPPSP